jgi:riboflavin synthase
MFTGIIEEIGQIKLITPSQVEIRSKKILEDLALGDSVSVNGLCLTVNEKKSDSFAVEVMPETLRRSNLRYNRYGDIVNLERAMAAGGRFGGHFVEGHVDDVGRVLAINPEDKAMIMKISIDSKLNRYIVEKGFVAIDGVSLTVTNCSKSSFSVSLVGFTRQNTTLGNMVPRKYVNIEVDILGKYIEKLTHKDKGSAIVDFLVDSDLSKSRWN